MRDPLDPADVAADDRFVEDLRAGRVPATAALGFPAWKAEIDTAPPIFAELAERYGLDVDTAGYIYTDPAADPAWPRIADPVDDALPDAFPPGWGGAPTERDQAAIDAGNA